MGQWLFYGGIVATAGVALAWAIATIRLRRSEKKLKIQLDQEYGGDFSQSK